MVNYNKGKIYCISSINGNVKYYGSTTLTLSMRMSIHRYMHKKNIRKLASYDVLKYDDCKIELVEECKCNSRKELLEREKYYIKNNECTNKRIPSRGIKEYYDDNKNEILQQKKEYYQINKEILKQKSLERYYKKKEQQQQQNQ